MIFSLLIFYGILFSSISFSFCTKQHLNSLLPLHLSLDDKSLSFSLYDKSLSRFDDLRRLREDDVPNQATVPYVDGKSLSLASTIYLRLRKGDAPYQATIPYVDDKLYAFFDLLKKLYRYISLS